MNEVRNGEQKEQKYIYFEMFYSGQKLHKYFRSLLIRDTSLLTCLKKNQTTPRPFEHPPVMGEKMSKRLGGIKRLQIIQNLFMLAFKQVPRCR